jgi:hypothetical protein
MHRPFLIRKSIVLVSVSLAVVVGLFYENLGFFSYFYLAVLLDYVCHYILGVKPSQFVIRAQLKKHQHVTPRQLDRYFDTRRNIRGCSLILAGVAAAYAQISGTYALEVFCLSYVIATFVGILCVCFFLKLKRPKLFRRDDRYYAPHRRMPGRISAAEFSLSTTDRGPMGVFES